MIDTPKVTVSLIEHLNQTTSSLIICVMTNGFNAKKKKLISFQFKCKIKIKSLEKKETTQCNQLAFLIAFRPVFIFYLCN